MWDPSMILWKIWDREVFSYIYIIIILMLHTLTAKQQRVAMYYQKYIGQHGHAPTYQEASEELKISPSVVHNHVKNLEKFWYMVTQWWSYIQAASGLQKLPLLGAVACGEPISVYESVDEYVDVPSSMLKDWQAYYALRAKGKSMIKAGISDNDVLIIRKQDTVNDGDIAVVVTADEEATLKRVFRKPLSIMLKAENDEFPDIVLTDPGTTVRGKLVNVLRQY